MEKQHSKKSITILNVKSLFKDGFTEFLKDKRF